MTTSARASVSPAPAAAPISARRPPAKIRLLLVSSSALPTGVDSALATSPFECMHVDATLSGVNLRRSDVIVIPKNEVLFGFVAELELKLNGGGSAIKPSVLVVARAPGKPRRLSDKIDVAWVEPCDDVAVLAKRVISRAGELMIAKGVARRRSSKPNSAAPAIVALSNPPESNVAQTIGAISLPPYTLSQPAAQNALEHHAVEPCLVSSTIPVEESNAVSACNQGPHHSAERMVAPSAQPELLDADGPTISQRGRSLDDRAPLDVIGSAHASPVVQPAGSVTAAMPKARPAIRPAAAERGKSRSGESAGTSPTRPLNAPAAPMMKHRPISDDAALHSAQPAPAIRSIMPKALHVEGSRWLLLDDDVARAHAVAKALEIAGAKVLLSGTHPAESRIHLLRQFGAAGVIIEESNIDAMGPLLQRFQQDPWLRHASLVPIRWQQIYDCESQRVDQEALKLRVLPHWQPEHDLLEALSLGQTIPIAQLCPAKLLHAAARGEFGGELTLENGSTSYTLTVTAGRLHSLRLNGDERLQTASAEIAELLALDQGSATLIEAAHARMTAGSGVALDTLVGAAILGGSESPAALQPSELVPQAIVRVPESSQPPSGLRDVPASLLITSWRQGTARLVSSCRGALRYWSTSGREKRRHIVAILAAIVVVALLTMGLRIDRGQASDAVPAPPVPANPQASLAEESAPRNASRPIEGSAQVATKGDGTQAGYPLGCERWLKGPRSLHGGPPSSEHNPEQAKSEWYGARKAIHLGDWDRAEELLCRSAAMDPRGPGAVGLADLFLSRGNLLQADGWGTWALSHQPRDSKAKQMLADVRSQQGRTDEARAMLHESMNVSAADQLVLKQVARKYTDVGYKALRALDPYQARRLFWRARVLDGSNALACVGLAELELRDGDPKLAVKWALEATNLDPDCFSAQLALGDARAKNEEPSLAKQAWLEAARVQPRSTEVRKRLGL